MTIITENVQSHILNSTVSIISTTVFQELNNLSRTSCLNTAFNIPIPKTHEYTDIAYAPLMHVLTSSDFSPSEKLSYILSDLYGAKTVSYNSNEDRAVRFSAKKLSEVIGYSERTALRVEQKLEQLGYFSISRTKNGKNRNNVNVITPTVPDIVFQKLLKQNIRNGVDLSEIDLSVANLCKRSILDRVGQYISFNMSIMKRVLFCGQLSALDKVNFIHLYVILHLVSTKRNRVGYYAYFELTKLQKELTIGRTSFFEMIARLSKLGIITKEQFFVQDKDDIDCINKNSTSDTVTSMGISETRSNRFDKSIWRFTVTCASDQILDTDNLQNPINSSNPISINPTDPISLAQNAFSDDKSTNSTSVLPTGIECASPLPDTMEVRSLTPLIRRNKIIKIDKEKKDKKEIVDNALSKFNVSVVKTSEKSLSIFYNLLNFKKKKEALVSCIATSIQHKPSHEGEGYSNRVSKEVDSVKHRSYSDYDKPKSLMDFHPVSEGDRETLNNKSGKTLSLDFINSLLASIASKMDKTGNIKSFKHKGAFLKYFSLVLKYEMRDEEKEIEAYLCKIEDDAIYKRTEFNQLKAKLINTLPVDIAYPLAKSMIYTNLDFKSKLWGNGVKDNIDASSTTSSQLVPITITLTKDLEISKYHKERILTDIKAVYGNHISELRFRVRKADKIITSKIESTAEKDFANIKTTAHQVSETNPTQQTLVDYSLNSQKDSNQTVKQGDNYKKCKSPSLITSNTKNIETVSTETIKIEDTIWGNYIKSMIAK